MNDGRANTAWTRRPAFWLAYALLAAVALVTAWRLFPLAIPIVNLDVTLSRGEAIARAGAIAARLKLAPEGAISAARFTHDASTQNYVELEGGGKPAFTALIAGDLYAPYAWDVRMFRPGTVEEVTVQLRPDGTPNGFVRKVPETYVRDPATKALDPDAARALAEERARVDWKVDLGPYKPLDQSKETQPTGRVDHVFVYERAERLGDARIRLRLAVAGDELIQVVPFVHIPEAFVRRYSELRSANNTIAGVASISAGLLYGLGGCILGVLWLARKHWLLVRPALFAGFIVGGLMAASSLSAAPAAWFGFDTAQSARTFWLRQGGSALVVALGGGLAYALVFMAAESLTRRAFGHQPQLWRLWSREGGATRAALGRTMGGYLFVPLELALVAAFYYATNRWLGWWQPSEVLTDPNILAYAVPALMPIAVSLQAGFMEESLFRAVPLALGALIGAHFGWRHTGIAIAFVLQALVFGAAHANYPGFPAYSRLVELILPSLLWAAIFLRFGLLPTILLHALFDLSLFSIPLFLVDAPGAWLQRAFVGAAACVPLAMLLWRRFGAGRWTELPAALMNRAWTPPSFIAAPTVGSHGITPSRIAGAVQRALPGLGLAGLAAWIAFTPMHADAPALALDRRSAEAAADAALTARGVVLGTQWRRTSVVREPTDGPQWTQHKFVWREAGPAAYRALVGSTLAPPLWDVRYAMFEGDVTARAEEWRVTVEPGGGIRQVRHALPEAAPGARLSREDAQALAERELASRFDLGPGAASLVAAESTNLPARTDWSFVYADPRVAVGGGGQARIVISIAGADVVGAGRFVYVPETWLRAEREREGSAQVVRVGVGLVFALAAIAALVLGVRSWMRDQCDMRALRIVFAVSVAASIGAIAMMWPVLAMKLKTTEPIASQVAIAAAGAVLAAALGALVLALAAGVGMWAARTGHRTPLAGRLPPWAAGVAAALFVSGAAALAGRLAPAETPLWPSLALLSTLSPPLSAALEGLGVISTIGFGLFLLHILDRVTAAWTRRSSLAVFVVAVLIAGLIVVKRSDVDGTLVLGVVAGLIAAGLVLCVLRFDPRTLCGYLVTTTILSGIENAALQATRSGWITFGISAAVTVACGYLIARYIGREALPYAATTSDETPTVLPADTGRPG